MSSSLSFKIFLTIKFIKSSQLPASFDFLFENIEIQFLDLFDLAENGQHLFVIFINFISVF